MYLTPRKQNFSEIFINAFGGFVAGLIGSIFILIITFILSNYFNIVSTFELNKMGTKANSMFPLLISLLTLFGTSITSYLSYYILNMTDPEKYKSNSSILSQLSVFQILTYIFITPIYIYVGISNYNNLMIIFIFHTIIIIFGTNLLLEIFNNYRYLLIGFYGSFIGLFFSVLFSVYIFNTFGTGTAKLIMLVLLLPIINFITILLKQVFELVYYSYYTYTSYDSLGNIFYKIEEDYKEKEKTEEEKNSI
ncbi:hypothetical protein HUU51_00415 [Candidatus Gracilibacteria bacterium]|nr:hypothetical protein [Candidatus Gracilibacteria bacterium]